MSDWAARSYIHLRHKSVPEVPPYSNAGCLNFLVANPIVVSSIVAPGPGQSSFVAPGPGQSSLVAPGPGQSSLVAPGPGQSSLVAPGVRPGHSPLVATASGPGPGHSPIVHTPIVQPRLTAAPVLAKVRPPGCFSGVEPPDRTCRQLIFDSAPVRPWDPCTL